MTGGDQSSDDIITHSDFTAFVGDDTTRDVLNTYTEEFGFPASVIQQGGVNNLIHLVENSQNFPRIIVVDIDGVPDALAKTVRVVEALEGVSKIIALGSANDVNLFRGLLSAGAADYIVKPITIETITGAFQNAEKQLAAENPSGGTHAGKTIVFIGVRGGVGTSTVAVNTAWLLAHRLNYKTALFDMDLQFGTAALALDLVPGRGLREILENPARMDSLLLASSMVPESEKLSLLSTEEPVEDTVNADASAVSAVVADLKKNYNFTLVDLPRHRLSAQKKLLAESDVVVLVAEQTLAAIRDVVRLKNALKVVAPQARVLHVMSRTNPVRNTERSAQVDQPTFERAIQDKIALVVPEDPAPVANASNRGQPLGKIAPSAPITLATLQLAEILAGRRATVAKKKMWDRIKTRFAHKDKKA